MRRHLLITAAALLLAPAWASEPGRPAGLTPSAMR